MSIQSLLNEVERTAKPRTNGVTWVIDTGVGVSYLDDMLGVCSGHVDMVKLAFGTSLITQDLDRKLDVLRKHTVKPCLGGTLFEVLYLRGKLGEYRTQLKELGITTVEISDGTVDIPVEEKLALIESFAQEFEVVSEVGSKDASVVVAPNKWVKSIEQELAAGASKVILEGRESGTAGLYRTTGEMRIGLLEEVLDAGIDQTKLVFEAPQKAHQVYLISLIGPNVNLGNIAADGVIACESLRRGLRGDTVALFHGPNE